MSLNVFWFLPTHGDGHYLGSARGRAASITVICSRSPRRLIGWDSAGY